MTDEEFLSWAAGFIEAEGCFGYSQLSVPQTRKKPVQELRDYFDVGHVAYKERDGSENWSNIWIWRVSRGPEIDYVYKSIRPHLRFREDEVEEVLEQERGPSDWTEEEKKFVWNNWETMTDEEMAAELDRPVRSVARRRYEKDYHRV